MSQFNAGTIKGAVEIERGGAISSMAAVVTAVSGGAGQLRALLSRPFAAAFDATGLRQQLSSTLGQAASFAKTIKETAASTVQMSASLGSAERAVRSLNDQSGEFARTLRLVSTSSRQTTAALDPLPAATLTLRAAVSGLRSDTGSLATAMQRVSARSEELGVATTSVSGRVGTLGRNLTGVPPAALSSTVALAGLTTATSAYAVAAGAAAAAAQTFRAAVEAAGRGASRAGAAKAAAAASTANMARAAAGAATAEAGLVVWSNAAAASATHLATAARAATREIVLMRAASGGGQAGQMIASLQAAMQRLLPALDSGVPRVSIFGRMVRYAAGEAAAASPAVVGFGSSMLALPGPAGSAAVATGGLTTALGALVAVAVVVGPPLAGLSLTMRALESTPVKLAAELEQTTIAFRTMTGSAANADALLRELRAFADTTPFEFPELASAGKQLLAMGIAASQIVPSLRMLGDISSGLGQPIGEMAYLFGQIRSQGRAMTQDLNQFAGRGVPIYSALAKVMHTNELGVRSFAEAGKIGFAEIQAAMRSLTAEGGKFHNLTETQSQSLKGLKATLSDAFTSLQTAAGQAIAESLDLAGSVKAISSNVEAIKPVVVGAIRLVGSFLSPLIGSFQSFVGLGTQLSRVFSQVGSVIESAFGARATSMLGSVFSYLNLFTGPIKIISRLVDAIAWTLKQIADLGDQVGYLFGAGKAEAAHNRTAATKKEVDDAIVARDKRRADRLAGEAPNGNATGAASAGGGAGGGGVGGGGSGGSESDAGKEAARLSDLQNETLVTKLRTAGQEYAATIAELNARFGRELAAAKSSEEIRAVQLKYRADREAVDAKAYEERAKTLRESFEREQEATIRTQIASLKAAGDDLKARLAEIALEYRPKLANGTATPHERAAIEKQMQAEISEAKADAEAKAREKAARADEKAREKKVRDDESALELRERIESHQLAARAATLESQGRKGEAELLRFDSEWRKRLALTRDADERSAAAAEYQALRVLKLGEAAGANGVKAAGMSSAAAPTSVDEARQRVTAAKGGSGERELARLQLRELLGKSLTSDEQARRLRLGERFGISQAADLPSMPTSLAGVDRMLDRPGRGTSPAARPPTTPTVNVSNQFELDDVALARVVASTVEPLIDRKLANMERAARDRVHAANVGGGI